MNWKIFTYSLFLALFFSCSIVTAQQQSKAKLIKTNLAPNQVQTHTNRQSKAPQAALSKTELISSQQTATLQPTERKALIRRLENWLATGNGTATERQHVLLKLEKLRAKQAETH